MTSRAPTIIAALVAGAGAWALWPMADVASTGNPRAGADSTPTNAAGADKHMTENVAIRVLDQSAFRAPLWVTPPPPPPPPPAPAPPPPLKLQLLAIVGSERAGANAADDGTSPLRAMLYDPDQDAVLTVAAGDSLPNGRVVQRVDRASVSIREASRNGPSDKGPLQPLVRTLTLDSSTSAESGGKGGR